MSPHIAFRLRLLILGLAVLALLVLPGLANADCWSVSYSRAYNDYSSGTGWCEGFSEYDCTVLLDHRRRRRNVLDQLDLSV